MLNAASEVLYVGKARNLKARVSNYARPSGHSGRIARMIHETASMMFLTTRTETRGAAAGTEPDQAAEAALQRAAARRQELSRTS